MTTAKTILRETPAALPRKHAIPTIQSHLHLVLRLAQGLEEPEFSAKVHELLAKSELLKVEDKPGQ